jgi:hypothetical protein
MGVKVGDKAVRQVLGPGIQDGRAGPAPQREDDIIGVVA